MDKVKNPKGDVRPAKAQEQAPTEEPKKADTGLRTQSEIVKLTRLSLGKVLQAAREGFISSNEKRLYSLGQTLLGLLRFQDSRWNKQPVYDNVEQCSEATGIPVSVIKQFRRKSKEAFRDNRVHLEPLLRQIFKTKEVKDWRGIKEEHEAIQAQFHTKQLLGETLDRTEVSKAIKKCVSGFWFAFDRGAEIEWPPILKGCDEEQIKTRMVAAGRKLKVTLMDELRRYMRNGESDAEGNMSARSRAP